MSTRWLRFKPYVDFTQHTSITSEWQTKWLKICWKISCIGLWKNYCLYKILANLGPTLPGKLTKQYKGTHLDILRDTKFSLPWPIRGTPGSGSRVCGVVVVLRTFSKSVGRSVQNLVQIGLAVCTWKGDIGRYMLKIVLLNALNSRFFFIFAFTIF